MDATVPFAAAHARPALQTLSKLLTPLASAWVLAPIHHKSRDDASYRDVFDRARVD